MSLARKVTPRRRRAMERTPIFVEPNKLIRYVYIDVVGYTQGRSVEAQTEVIASINKVVRSPIENCELPLHAIVFLPSGAGMAI